ncbi:hypothetical protein QO189_05940 [Psychrobacter sp. Arc29]|uniref:hypothetical protein n=1 Tax=Psychrobacter sp. Arc29 TaxID=3046690 RepID=UPI00352E0620
MESALIGLVGILLGIILGEYFHRNKRIEVYSQKVFDRRLSVHEELYTIFVEGGEIVSEAMTNTNLNETERKSLVSSVIHSLCKFMDTNAFYLNEDVMVQVATAYMGAEDVLNYDDDLNIATAKEKVYKSSRATKEIILQESGVTEVFRHFSIVSKSKPDSAIIRYFKSIKKLRG